MDLISREATLEAVKIPYGEYPNPSERHGIIIARVEARRRIREIPSAPAVPMDMLCEWLADYAAPPANASNEKALENHETRALIWRHFWEKHMEQKEEKK